MPTIGPKTGARDTFVSRVFDNLVATGRAPQGRDLQVLRLMARGATTREISRELRISAGTVRNHSGKILRSLKVHTRLQAIATARALHLIG